MSEQFVTLEVHTEFAKRIEAEDTRQNKRLERLEEGQMQISKLVTSVEVLATNIKTMSDEISKQGQRLEDIEAQPKKRWETVVACIITGLVGAAISAILSGLIH